MRTIEASLIPRNFRNVGKRRFADCAIGGAPVRTRALVEHSAADGRHSTLRAAAGLPVEDLGAPIDVLWFRVGRDPGEADSSLARIAPGHFVVTIDRGDYW